MFESYQIKEMNDLELAVYNYVMKNRDKVQYMKIRDLAEASNVSTTTVMRFCKKVGCGGYAEFKVKFKLYLTENLGHKADDDVTEAIDYLKKAGSPEYEAKLDEVFEILREANRVVFFGSGTSGSVAKYGARYFSGAGKLSLYIDDPYYPTLGKFYENAVVFVFSVSGETYETINHISRFKRDGCTIISVTNTENNTIAKLSDYNIPYYVSYLRNDIYDLTSQIPVISIIERIGRKLYNDNLEPHDETGLS